MVFYRKYRPQKIAELDSEVVRKTLESTVRSGGIAHAFLFAGPKGLGKTSAARILAKIVNCERLVNQRSASRQTRLPRLTVASSSVEPCNKCSQCTSITQGSNLDVLEIDGASNRGIDEIRDLREKIKLAPFSSRMKVYIIDEVHMLTAEAFNALLKTLEEPPPHAMFILATTEVLRLPETITSRCFVISFTKPTSFELVRSLTRVIKGEKITIEKDAILKITEMAEGSFRDAVKLLEQVATMAGRKKIKALMVEELKHASNISEQVEALVQFLSRRDAKEALVFVNREVTKGLNVKFLMEKLLEKLHVLLLKSIEGEDVGFTLMELKHLMEVFNKAAHEVKYAVLPQLPLELGIIEYSLEDDVEVALAGSSSAKASAGRPAAEKSVGMTNNFLDQLIQKVKPHNHSIAGILRGCSIQTFDGKKLIIETNYQFHKDRLSEQKAKELLEKVCKEMVGNKISVNILLKNRPN